MRPRSIPIVIASLAACGGDGGPAAHDAAPGSDADPGSADPQFDDGGMTVTVTEGRRPWSDQSWTGLQAWLSDSPDYLTETDRTGSCRIRVSDADYCGDCEGEDYCVGGECVPWPRNRSAGTIEFDGLAAPLALVWQGSYYSTSPGPPDDLFAAGDAITAIAPGDQVGGFALTASGVETIAPRLGGECENVFQLTRGEDAELTWPDPIAGARVSFRLPSPNNGHGLPPLAELECEAPDTGRLVVPAALIDALPDLAQTDPCAGVACAGFDCPPATLARYTRDASTAGAEAVQLRVASEVAFYVLD